MIKERITKKAKLLAHMEAGEWEKAMSIAAKFPRLGDKKQAITRAHNACVSPDFYRQIKQNPEAHFGLGIQALKDLFWE